MFQPPRHSKLLSAVASDPGRRSGSGLQQLEESHQHQHHCASEHSGLGQHGQFRYGRFLDHRPAGVRRSVGHLVG